MRIFVTGSESFIGKELIRQCAQNSIDVTGVDIARAQGRDMYSADIRSADIGMFIPEEADAVVHLAALSRDSDCRDKGYECFETNVLATLNLAEAAQERRVKQFIFASTEWVYDSFDEETPKTEETPINAHNLESEYALSKLVSEVNLKQKFQRGFCPVTILRFGIIYGPRKANWSAVESLTHSVGTQDEVTVGSIKTARAFVHVSDIVSGIIASIGLAGFNIINLQGSRLVTLGEVIDTAKKRLGKNPSIVEKAPGRISVRSVSGRAAENLIGWVPRIGIEEGVASIIPALGLD